MTRHLLSLITCGLVASGILSGDTIFTLNTTPLQSSAAGPFTLDFQFDDGNGTGDANNTVTLSNFALGGGSINATPTSSMGGVNITTGPFGVTLTDSSFFNDLQFSFTPGTSLAFQFDATANNDATAPDAFTFAIYDGSGNEIATTNPNGFDSFVEVDLPSGSSGTATILSGSAAGASVALNAPSSQPAGGGGATAPEPASWAMLSLIAGAALTRRWWRAQRPA